MRRSLVLALLLLVTVQPAIGAPPHVEAVPVVCAADAATGAGRAVVVYAYGADRASRHGPIAPLLRDLVAQVNGALVREATPFPANYIVECDGAGNVLVHEVQLATSRAHTTFDTIKRDLAASGHARNDSKYWVWFDGPSPFAGELGTSDIFGEPLDSPANRANVGPHYAVVWGATGSSLDWRVLMHESAHTMGAVLPDAWEATGDGHTDAPSDVLIAVLENPSVNPTHCYSPWKCRVYTECSDRWYFDCGHDTYFNADPAQSIIGHWQIGSRNNRFLDFSDQPPYNAFVFCPGPAQAGASVRCSSAAFDREGTVSYRFDFGDGTPPVDAGPAPSAVHVFADHAWDAPGNYTYSVVATDAQGGTVTASDTIEILGCSVRTGGLIRLGVPFVEVEGVTATSWMPIPTSCRGLGYALTPAHVDVQWRDAQQQALTGCGRIVPATASEFRIAARSGTNVIWTFETPAAAAPC